MIETKQTRVPWEHSELSCVFPMVKITQEGNMVEGKMNCMLKRLHLRYCWISGQIKYAFAAQGKD